MSWLNILRIKEHKNLNSSQPSQYILKCASKAFVMLNSKAGKKAINRYILYGKNCLDILV